MTQQFYFKTQTLSVLHTIDTLLSDIKPSVAEIDESDFNNVLSKIREWKYNLFDQIDKADEIENPPSTMLAPCLNVN